MGWLSGYSHRIRIPINYSADGELTNFQVRITLLKSTGSNSAGNIYLQNLCQNWPYDIRFTSSDGSTLIDFWRQEYDSTDGTWVVEIPTIAASGTTDIYLYWGKAADADASSAANTAKDGAGYVFPDNGALDEANFWTVKSGSPQMVLNTEYPDATSGTTVSAESSHYEAFPAIVRDSAGKLYVFYRTCDSDTHGYEASGRICYKISTDDGATWGSEVDVTSVANMDERDPVALVYSNGGVESILLAYFEYDSSYNCRAYCQIAPVSTMSFSAKAALSGTNNRATHGDPIELSNGKILIPLYDSSTWKTYVVYSTDDGANWSEVEIATDATHQIDETVLIELKTTGSYSGKVAAIMRTEASPYAFYKAESTDYGATWGTPASMTLSSNPDVACPPEVKRMQDGNIILIYTDGNNIIYNLSVDECANWFYGAIAVDRSSPEKKHYAKALFYGGYMYLAWCTNETTSGVYFNKIKMYPMIRNTAASYWQSSMSISKPAVVEARIQFQNEDATYKYATYFQLGKYLSDYSTDCLGIIIYTTDQYALTATHSGSRSITSGITKDLNFSIFKIIWDTDVGKIYDDGVQKGTTLTTNIPTADMPILIGRSYYTNAGNRAHLDWVFARKYTANEPTWATPASMEYSMVIGAVSYTLAIADVTLTKQGGAYTLSIGAASYSLSASSVGLLRAAKIDIGAASYSLSFSDLTLRHGYSMAIGQAAYSVAAQDLGLRADRKLPVGAVAYSLSPQAIGLLTARKLPVDALSFSLSAQDLALLYGRVLPVGALSYACSPQDIGLLAGRKLAVGVAAYDLSLSDVDLRYLAGYFLSIGAVSYSLSPQDIGLRADRKLPVEAASYSMSPQALGLLRGARLSVGAADYALSASDVGLLAGRKLAVGVASYSLTIEDIILRYLAGYTLLIGPVSYSLSPQAIDLKADRRIAPEAVAYTMSAQDLGLHRGYKLPVGQVAHALTLQDLELKAGRRLGVEAAAYVLSAEDLGLLAARKLLIGAVAYSCDSQAVGLYVGRKVACGPVAYILTAEDLGLLKDSTLTIGSAEYVLVVSPLGLYGPDKVVYAVRIDSKAKPTLRIDSKANPVVRL